MPLLDTTGSNTADAYGGGAAAVPNYIEDVFSTYLYTGNGSTQTITNGIDLSTKGGLVWTKDRTVSFDHALFDTNRGYGNFIKSNSSSANINDFDTLTSFNTNGFSLGSDGNYGVCNLTGNYVSWTFRKQPKFFDVVTWTGNGGTRTLSHNLGSVPGCMIVKKTDSTQDWSVYHRGLTTPATDELYLNLTSAANTGVSTWNNANPTSTTFSVDSARNANTSTYVAYIFAHNAGGFGLTGTDNVISCGSFTPSSGNATVNLGYEPQWVLIKNSQAADNWQLLDTMRSWDNTNYARLFPNTSSAEGNATNYYVKPTSTGFNITNFADQAYIYIAIRRGPMKVPTDATKVFLPQSPNSSGSFPCVVTNFPVDLGIVRINKTTTSNSFTSSRLQGQVYMYTNTTAAEASDTSFEWDSNTGWLNLSGANLASWNFRRAPSFFDEVCYTGTGSATTFNHNLGVAPELIIVKCRSTGGTNRGWWTYVAPVGNTQALYLNTTDNAQTAGIWNNTTPTSTVFSVDGSYLVNGSGATYVAYLFATCPGVSKVGSYTGTGATQTISCGFTGGARFVLVKRTDTTGDWYIWDTARGMVSGTDPSLLLNSTAAEVNANSIYTTTGGFQIVSTASGINASGGTYIFLAIA